MSAGSLPKLIKALVNVLDSNEPPYPLPTSVTDTIQLYLERYRDISELDSQRLQDELLNLYNKLVVHEEGKHAVFLAFLRRLRPAIRGSARLLQWWDLLSKPTIEGMSSHKGVVIDARDMLLSVLVFDEDDDMDGEKARTSASLVDKLLQLYLERTSIPGPNSDLDLLDDEKSAFIAGHLEAVLVAYGRKKPKAFLQVIDACVVKKEHRAQALGLLCCFVRHQPPHLHEVLKTQLLEHLLQCLMIDTSTTVLCLALTTLVMFLPHVPSSVAGYLPRLFSIYARILCWETADTRRMSEESATSNEEGAGEMGTPGNEPAMFIDSSWDILHRSADLSESSTPDLMHLFTVIYGLYPLNFMSFLRKPAKYLRDMQLDGAESLKLDTNTVHHRSEHYRRLHLLHPHFYTMTAEAELADTHRFLESEPADVVAQCMSLCAAIPVALNEPGPPPTGKLPVLPRPGRSATEEFSPHSLLDDGTNGVSEGELSPTSKRHSWRTTQSTAVSFTASESMKMLRKSSQHSQSRRSSRGTSRVGSPELIPPCPHPQDSPTLPSAQLTPSASGTRLKDMLQAQEALRSNLRHNSDASIGPHEQPRLDAYIQSLSQAPNTRSRGMTDVGAPTPLNRAFLQREVLLLKNDLNFERYLKQQHLSHIGQLQRKYIREATIEAETQKLINSNKTLRIKQEEAKKTLAVLRKETTLSKNHAKKWEAELNAKYKGLREAQRKWQDDEATLRRELSAANQECDQLKKLVVETEAKELFSRQKLQAVATRLAELEPLRGEVEALHEQIREHESKQDEFDYGRQTEEIARTQLETLRLKFQARNGEMERVKKVYEERLGDISARLQKAQQSPAHNPQAFQAMLDSAIASGHVRYEKLKSQYKRLLDRYAQLDLRYMDLQSQMGGTREGDSYDGSGSGSGDRSGLRTMTGHVHLGNIGDDFNFFGGGNSNGGGGGGGYHDRGEEEEMEPRARQASMTGSAYEGYGPPSTQFAYRGSSSTTPMTAKFPNPPARLESLEDYGSMDGYGRMNSIGGSEGLGQVGYGYQGSSNGSSMTAFEHSLAPLRSRGRDSDNSSENSAKTKAKIQASSQVRVYGRGGVQNIGKKKKEDKEVKGKKSLTPAVAAMKSFRGFGS